MSSGLSQADVFTLLLRKKGSYENEEIQYDGNCHAGVQCSSDL